MWLFSLKINFFATSSSSLTKYKRINIWQLTWVFSIVSYHTLWQWKMWRHKWPIICYSVSSKGVYWLIVITILNKNLLFLCILSNDGSSFIFCCLVERTHEIQCHNMPLACWQCRQKPKYEVCSETGYVTVHPVQFTLLEEQLFSWLEFVSNLSKHFFVKRKSKVKTDPRSSSSCCCADMPPH